MDSANKTFFLMVVLTMVCFGITLYQFFNPVKDNVVQNQENLNKNNEINISYKKTDFLLKNEVSVLNEKITYESDKLKVVFNANSGDIANIFIKTCENINVNTPCINPSFLLPLLLCLTLLKIAIFPSLLLQKSECRIRNSDR